MKQIFSISFFLQILRISVPYVLAALGGTISERSGVINIALEGMLLVGAFAAAVGGLTSGSALLGVASGVIAGLLLAALYGVAVIKWRADQIVCGVAITLLALGATRFFLKLLYNSTSNSPRLDATGSFAAPMMIGTAVLVAVVHVTLFDTRLGLRLRSVGEHPEAAVSVGVAATPMRWFGVLASGAFAGAGGVWLAFDQHGFVANMSAGRGFIALAAMILGGWTPVGALIACLGFGAAEALQLRLQSSGFTAAAGTVQSIPYLLTIAALALRGTRAVAPKALGKPL